MKSLAICRLETRWRLAFDICPFGRHHIWVPDETDRRPVRIFFRLHSQNTPSFQKILQSVIKTSTKHTVFSISNKGAQGSTTHRTDGVKGAPFRILHAPEAGYKANGLPKWDKV